MEKKDYTIDWTMKPTTTFTTESIIPDNYVPYTTIDLRYTGYDNLYSEFHFNTDGCCETYHEFINKHNLKLCQKTIDILKAFDILYLEFTKQQALEMLSDYFSNADSIYNTYIEELENKIK